MSVRDAQVRFGDVDVLIGIDLDVGTGEIHGLIGENGASRSTLGKVLGGNCRASAGTNAVEGTRLEELMDESGLRLRADALAGSLIIAEQQKIEILRALARKAQVIVMDESTAALSKVEIDQLHRIMRALRDEGRSVVYVTHFLGVILDVTDRITVLRNWALVQTCDTSGETKEKLVSAMLGSAKTETLYPAKNRDHDDVVLSVRDLASPNGTNVGMLDIRAGEIVGFAGLVGAGRSEIAPAIIGADPATSWQARPRC